MSFVYLSAARSTREALRLSLRDRAEQFQIWLFEGQLTRVNDVVDRIPAALADLLPIVANPEANMNVRFGASAVLERHAGRDSLRALIPTLGLLAAHGDARVRADACHLLGLSASPKAIPYLEGRREDPDAEVREIVAESLEELQSL